MDFEYLASQLGVDLDDFIELAELFVTTTLADMEKITTAMAEANPGDAAAAAHSIKGAAGNLGFDQMADLAQTMEFQGKAGDLAAFPTHMHAMEQMMKALQAYMAGQ